MKNQETGGIKHDSQKIRLDLLSSSWIMGVGAVLTFGATKYAAHNWRKGIALSRLLGACLRHVFAFLAGEDKDSETGLSHLYHASCCLMFASELHSTNPELDDRYKGVVREENPNLNEPVKTEDTVKNEEGPQSEKPSKPNPVEGEWIQVEVDNVMQAAFVPKLIDLDHLPTVYFEEVVS